MPHCCRAGAVLHRSSVRCRPVTSAVACRSCRWRPGSTRARSCCGGKSPSRRARPAARCTTGWHRSAPRLSSPRCRAGTLHAKPQPATGASYAGKLHKDEANLDWSRPAVELDRQVRAFNPWPVAVTTLAGEPVRIWQSQPLPGAASPDVAPGTVVTAADGRIVVATGAGLLELQTLQFAGRKPLAARDVLNSRSLAGARFGAGIA
jgi:hypothetical protein